MNATVETSNDYYYVKKSHSRKVEVEAGASSSTIHPVGTAPGDENNVDPLSWEIDVPFGQIEVDGVTVMEKWH